MEVGEKAEATVADNGDKKQPLVLDHTEPLSDGHDEPEQEIVAVPNNSKRRRPEKEKKLAKNPSEDDPPYSGEDLTSISDRELKEAIDRKTKILSTLSFRLPDGGVALKAKLQRLQDEMKRRQEEAETTVADNGEKKQPLDLYHIELLTDGDDEPEQEIVVVPTNPQRRRPEKKRKLARNNPYYYGEDLTSMSDLELKGAIDRTTKILSTLSLKLPDGGAKIKAKLQCLQDELKRRESFRSHEIGKFSGLVFSAFSSSSSSSSNVKTLLKKLLDKFDTMVKTQNAMESKLEQFQGALTTLQASMDEIKASMSINHQKLVKKID